MNRAHRRFQPVGVDTALACELTKSGRPLEVAAGQPSARRYARQRLTQCVAAAVAGIDDEVGRNRRNSLLARVLLVTKLHIRLCLVREPLSGRVDQDRVRHYTFGNEDHRIAVLIDKSGQPVRLIKIGGGSTDGGCREERIAGVRRNGGRPVCRRRLRPKFGSQGRISRVATRIEQHPVARPKRNLTPTGYRHDTGHTTGVDKQFLQRGVRAMFRLHALAARSRWPM